LESVRQILLPQPIEAEAVTFLEKEKCNIVVAPDPKPETVLPLIKSANGLILRTGLKITHELLGQADKLSVISRTGGGLDNIDVDAATEREVIVTSNLGVNTSSVVEHAMSLMLALSKKLPVMDKSVRSGNFAIRYQNLTRDMREKIIGFLGFGRIGSEVGRVCHQMFHMQVIAFDPYLSNEAKTNYQSWVKFVDFHNVFSKSDFISIHLPLTEETRNLIAEKELSWMKPDAILINTSRGPVIDEMALIKALQENKIGGAGLDVFTEEPVAADNPLLKLENVILTPHTAALTKECVIRMATEAAKCVVDVFNGREPPNVANRQVLRTDRWKHLVPRPKNSV
jgi:D-3-phosphoglycerate dehydrogenase